MSTGKTLFARLLRQWVIPVPKEAKVLTAPEWTLKCQEWLESQEWKRKKSLPAPSKKPDP